MKKILFTCLFISECLFAHYKATQPILKNIPKKITLKKLHKDPSVLFLTNFITPKEAEHIKKLAKGRMQRSMVEESSVDPGRTSSSAMFSNTEDEIHSTRGTTGCLNGTSSVITC